MSVVFINHLAGAPQKNDISLRHFFFAKELKKRGCESTIITSSNSYFRNSKNKISNTSKSINGIKYFFINESETKSINIFTKLVRMVSFSKNLYLFLSKNQKKINANHVFASSPDLLACLVAYFFSKKISAKFIFEIRDIWPLSQEVLHGYSKIHPVIFLFRRIEKFLHKKSNLVVSNLPNYEKYIFDNNLHCNKYIYAPQIIDFDFYKNNYFSDEDLSFEHNHIFKKYNNIGIYSGTIGSYYGIKHMISALIDYNKKSNNENNFALILMGDGDRRDDALKMKEKYNLNNLYILDAQKKSYLLNIHKKCSFGIVSFPDKRLYKYGIASLKMFDYLYSGIPILMLGPFNKYSILKDSKFPFHSNFGDINQMGIEFDKLCSLAGNQKELIKDEYRSLLIKNATINSCSDIISELVDNYNISS